MGSVDGLGTLFVLLTWSGRLVHWCGLLTTDQVHRASYFPLAWGPFSISLSLVLHEGSEENLGRVS